MLLRTVAAAVGLGSLGLLAAGCGGASKSPGVAQIGPATRTAQSSAPSAPSGGPPQSSTALLPFVGCMQKHGIQVQIASGGRGIGITGGGAGPNSPLFQKAQQACQKLLPGGGPKPLTPAQQAEANKELLRLAACMRTHGYPSFPDPSSQGVFDLPSAGGFDPNSSQFQSAMNACRPRASAVPLRIGFRVSGPGPSGSPATKSANAGT